MIKWSFFVLSAMFLTSAGATPTQDPQPQPTLAELARQTREKRSKAPERKVRVITNADLKSLRSNVSIGKAGQLAEAAASQPQQQADQPSPQVPEQQLSEEDLALWQQSFKEARDDLKIAVNEGLVLQLRMNKIGNAYLNRSDGATQERLQAQLAETMRFIEANKKAQSEARAAIRELQNKARQVGLSRKQIEEFTGHLPEPSKDIATPESQLQ